MKKAVKIYNEIDRMIEEWENIKSYDEVGGDDNYPKGMVKITPESKTIIDMILEDLRAIEKK